MTVAPKARRLALSMVLALGGVTCRPLGFPPVPQMGFPGIGPSVSTTLANTVPTSAEASANRSSRGSLRNRKNTPAGPNRITASSVVTAAGTCR